MASRPLFLVLRSPSAGLARLGEAVCCLCGAGEKAEPLVAALAAVRRKTCACKAHMEAL